MQGDSRGHGLWDASAPPAPSCRSLETKLAADVAIIGGGYTGLSAALHLAEGGASVVVLEAVEVGFGGSGRNVGLVNAGLWITPNDVLAILGNLYGERLLDFLGDAPSLVFELVKKHDIACEIQQQGTLHCAVGRKGLAEIEERSRQWQGRGAPVQVLSAAQTAEKLGTNAYSGALLDQRAGTIQPLAYVRGLAHAAIDAGATIYTASPVLFATDRGDHWEIQTASGEVRAEAVVVATNAYTKNVWPELRREVVHLPYFNMATRPLSDSIRQLILPEGQGAWDTRKILTSFRFDNAQRLVFGSVGALTDKALPIHREWGRRALARLFPQLSNVEFEYEWYGKIGMTNNSLPHFHRLGRNVVSFNGYNGRGIAPGTVFGRALARLLLGQISDADLPLPLTAPVDVPLRRIKETYYECGAQLAHLVSARF
jgi:glycine/D-amino acid oxidase-like deaminating enzyme